MNLSHVSLAVTLVICGSCATLLTKLSDEQTSPGIDGCERYFVHPFIQAWAMTFGECGLLLTYTVMFYCRKDKKEEVKSECKTDQNVEVNNSEVSAKNEKFYEFSPFLFLPCAIFHMIGRILFFISVTMTDVVSVQMLRGAIIIFTSVLARVFIRRKLPLYKWAAVLITTVGIVVVGLADILPNPLDKNDNVGVSEDSYNVSYSLSAFRYKSSMFSLDSFVGFPRPSYEILNLESDTDDCPEIPDKDSSEGNWVGDIMTIAAVALLACQMVYEDLFVKKYNCPPMLVLGTEGTFGFLMLSLMLVPLYWIPVGPNTTFVNSPNRVVEDSKDAFIQLANNPTLLGAFIGTFLLISLTNFAQITMTKALTSTHSVIMDQLRTLVIWIVSICAGWSEFNPVHLIGFFTLLTGMMLFNNILFGTMYDKCQKTIGKGSWTLEKEVELKNANVVSK